MPDFKDNFSRQSDTYSKYRPAYPDELFEYIQTLTPEHRLAWDCGTGNGQAAVSLAKYYEKVYATDPSKQQISNAVPHEKVHYKVEKAENSSLPPDSVDLVTAAQALHWFNFDAFYSEVARVLKKEGVLAVWTYGLPSISDEIDGLIYDFHDRVLGDYWLYENRLVDLKYSTIPFPFDEIRTPSFTIQDELSLDELLGLIRSWSALQRYLRQNKTNPVPELKNKLEDVWENPEATKMTTFAITIKSGKLPMSEKTG